ncbi:MAG TPA: serine/threonine-protein kinase, partial [Gemmatimonadales bacterium]|nr:serine/threonine-protein kinase [Gemmatimonadales bacterium]
RDFEPLPPREAIGILRDVARAMSYAHANGIIHRDIKPDNVLIAGGSAMVSDFGIAKAVSSSIASDADGAVLTRTGSSLGTPTYMAPEQSAADPAADHRVDLYAFGAMAYELLSGKPPFHNRTPQALLTAHLVEAPAPLAEKVAGLPAGLSAMVMQCLEKDPAKRPASADAVLERLESIDWSGERVAPSAPAAKRWVTPLAVVFALFLVGGLLAIAHRLGSRARAVRNPALMAIVPFRVASADPALHYLREGMLDLLAAKLPGEGGLQATDPRALLDLWHAAGGSGDRDLRTEDAQKLSEKLGAGWLLLGDVVGTPSKVTLNASLFATGQATPRTRVSVEGLPDSLGALVDQLVAQLLTSLSATGGQVASLNRASLPVLRAYLDATTKFRDGLQSSVAAFSEALERDTSFAPSALGLVQAIGWYGDGGTSQRPLRLAWEGRQQLSQKDQALLRVIAGPHYPAPSSTREVFDAAQQYLQLAPDRADAWYNYGDKIYHFGNALGFADRASRSAETFRKALALDSTYVPGYIHLQQLAAELGDTALDHRLVRLRGAIDTSGVWLDQQRWYRAVASQDSGTVAAALRAGSATPAMLFTIARLPLFVPNAGIDPALVAYDSLLAHNSTPGAIQNFRGAASALLLNGGRPAAALAQLDQIPAQGHLYVLGRQVLDAVLEAGDSTRAIAAITELTPKAVAPLARDSARVLEQAIAIRAVLTWRLLRGDTTGAAALISKLRPLAALPWFAGSHGMDEVSIATFEALLADRRGDRSAPALAERLDSLMANFDYTSGAQSRLELAAIVSAR